ncbi:MAG: class I SAM-dependent methyltransferase [Planctomycetota bacterium]
MRLVARSLLLLILTACSADGQDDAAVAPSTETPPARDIYIGRRIARTMHYLGAPWLVRDARVREEEPAKLMASLDVRPGQVVCDLGCGNGFYALRLAERVGPDGKVYAVDIQPEMLDLLRLRAEARSLANVTPVRGMVTDPKLPTDKLDLILLVDAYHEFSHPVQMLAAMRAALSPAGRVALVEFRAEDPAVPIKPLHKMTQQQCLKEFTANGYQLVGQFDGLPWQHVLLFARDDSPLPATDLTPWAPPAE